jgi:hypothetical protein
MKRVLLLVALGACGGSSWSGQDLPPGVVGLSTVWAFAPNDVWAGGTKVLHYDGASWQPVAVPSGGGVEQMWGAAPDDLWAVDGSSVLRWQGSSWTMVPMGSGSLTAGPDVVFGFSPTDLWVGGAINGEVAHYDGVMWTKYITQVVEVRGIWGAATDDVWAIGLQGFSHWNGSSWSSVSVSAAVDVESIWGTAHDDVWAVGLFQTLVHYDGTSWTAMTTDENGIAVWAPSRGEAWETAELGEITHFDGAWSGPERVGVTLRLNAVHGSSADDVWIVGQNLESQQAVILHR